MTAPGMQERARRSVKQFIRKWEAVQVELHGFYSTERFRAMTEYCRSTSFYRAVLMLLLTPIPCLILVALIDAMPLEDTKLGLAHSTVAWVRATLTCFIYTHCAVEQIRLYSPSLELTPLAGLCISIPTAILTNALGLLVSAYVCWPIPFASVMLSGPWLGFTTFFLLRVRGAHMRAHPEAVKDVVQFATMSGTQVTIVLLYAVFNTIFTNISPTYQPVFALLIPVFKVMQKNMLSRILAGRDDTKPQLVILNVEIFNALFISSCMQNSQSFGTSVTLIAIDILQAAISLVDLQHMLHDVKKITDKLGVSSRELIATAQLMADEDPALAIRRPTATVRASNVWASGSKGKQVLPTMSPGDIPLPLTKEQPLALKNVSNSTSSADSRSALRAAELADPKPPTGIDRLTTQEHYRLFKKALQVLFLTEFMLLIEFTEVLVPAIYGGYLTILYYLPNRRFYPQFAEVTDGQLRRMVFNVLGYGLLELGSLILLVGVLNHIVHRHSLQQLAFVMEREFFLVQPKLILWVTMTIQASLPQLGVDYTFEFAWLRDDYNSTSTA